MAGARLSPTANLLRNSRLFAVPQPIPLPSQAASSQPIAESQTATKPYPTHATIETSPSCLAKGDWGLKRPLPLKSTTKSSNPTVRFKGGIDTREHIVDFESASDHVLSLQKWQDLHLPVQIPQLNSLTNFRRDEPRSPFQSTFDNTKETSPDNKRWRFQGPWLAGQTGLEFEAYVERQVRLRKTEFLERLRADLASRKKMEQRRKAMEVGQDVKETKDSVEVSDAELREYIKYLRQNPADFGPIIHDFLDLPNGPDRPLNDTTWSVKSSYLYRQSRAASTRYGNEGVPSTHPSAGLSYLHHSAYVYNHPVFGPQAHPPPVQARVLASKQLRRNEASRALLGIAGFVAQDNSPHGFRSPNERDNGIGDFVIKPGGSKILASPKRASVDAAGRIHVETTKATSTQQRMYAEPKEEDPASQLPDVVKGYGPQVPPLDDRYGKAKPTVAAGRRADISSLEEELGNVRNEASTTVDKLKSTEEVRAKLNEALGLNVLR